MQITLPLNDTGDDSAAGREWHVTGIHIAHEDIDNWERA